MDLPSDECEQPFYNNIRKRKITYCSFIIVSIFLAFACCTSMILLSLYFDCLPKLTDYFIYNVVLMKMNEYANNNPNQLVSDAFKDKNFRENVLEYRVDNLLPYISNHE